MLDPFDLRSGQAVGPFLGSHEFQQTQSAVDRRARLDCEPGFERADAGAFNAVTAMSACAITNGGVDVLLFFCGLNVARHLY